LDSGEDALSRESQNPVALADLYLPVRINGDVALIKALLKYMLEEEGKGRPSGIDRTFISKYTDGFETLRNDVLAADWNTLLNATGLSMEHIRAAATMCIQSKATICCWATGVTQQPNGVDNVWMLLNLLLVGGHIGRLGAGTCCVRGHSNVQGDRVPQPRVLHPYPDARFYATHPS
jgi:anaerobic selenocysteine-containing dehydrogenase